MSATANRVFSPFSSNVIGAMCGPSSSVSVGARISQGMPPSWPVRMRTIESTCGCAADSSMKMRALPFPSWIAFGQ